MHLGGTTSSWYYTSVSDAYSKLLSYGVRYYSSGSAEDDNSSDSISGHGAKWAGTGQMYGWYWVKIHYAGTDNWWIGTEAEELGNSVKDISEGWVNNFAPLHLSCDGSGSIVVNDTVTVVSGTEWFPRWSVVKLYAQPSAGQSFKGWSSGETTNPLEIPIAASTSLTANFQQSDTDPPEPNPMEWDVEPHALSQTSISMRAAVATDESPPVEYYFDFYSGGGGGDDSGWQTSRDYTDSGLAVNSQYGYRVQARDSAPIRNTGSYSSVVYVYTLANVPGTPSVGNATTSTLDVDPDPNGNPAWTQFAIHNLTSGHYVAADGSSSESPVWQTDAEWGIVTVTGLSPDTLYAFEVKARNGDHLETLFGVPGSGRTGTPDLGVNKSEVVLGEIGGPTVDESVYVYGAGTGGFNWTVSGDEESWLTVSPSEGSIAEEGEHDTLTISVDPTGLTDGESYSGEFMVTRDGAPEDYEEVTVSFTYGSHAVDFSGSPIEGIVPLYVCFDNESSGDFTAWYWDFGDGGNSVAHSPCHEYESVGRYTVSLEGSYADGSDTETKVNYIKVAFPDVPPSHWACGEVLACVDAGIVSGYPDGHYHPEIGVSRAQMAVYISRSLAGGDGNVPDAIPPATFDDVSEDYWAWRYVEYAVGENVVQGYDPTTYAPEVEVTRDQMPVFIARARGWITLGDPMDTAPELFPDVPAGFWSGTAIEACADNLVVQGYPDGNYHPDNVVTRDQMAVYVARAFELPL